MKKSIGAKAIIFPAPTWIIGTYDKTGKPNVMTLAWGGICCSKPPCVGISLRMETYTYKNINERNAFTVNIPSDSQAMETDLLGTSSGREIDKLATVGFTAVQSVLVDAPYISEIPLHLECAVINKIDIGSHTQFIGQIVDVKAEDYVLNSDNLPDIGKIRPMIYCPGLRSYYSIGKYLQKAFVKKNI